MLFDCALLPGGSAKLARLTLFELNRFLLHGNRCGISVTLAGSGDVNFLADTDNISAVFCHHIDLVVCPLLQLFPCIRSGVGRRQLLGFMCTAKETIYIVTGRTIDLIPYECD